MTIKVESMTKSSFSTGIVIIQICVDTQEEIIAHSPVSTHETSSVGSSKAKHEPDPNVIKMSHNALKIKIL